VDGSEAPDRRYDPSLQLDPPLECAMSGFGFGDWWCSIAQSWKTEWFGDPRGKIEMLVPLNWKVLLSRKHYVTKVWTFWGVILRFSGSFVFHDWWRLFTAQSMKKTEKKGRLLKAGSEGLSHWKTERFGDPRGKIEILMPLNWKVLPSRKHYAAKVWAVWGVICDFQASL